MRVELPAADGGVFQATGLPIKLSRSPGRIERRPPTHGEHTDEVLRECGLSDGEIAGLRQRGVV
jgi:crotonobetainyl-CoA:carnitine CoA-transferase CaiB-like acyl-CoA transferase